MRIYLILKKISDVCFLIGKILGICTLFAILISMSLQVFMRYIANHALIWPEGLCKILFIWMSYIGVGIEIKLKGHLLIDFVINFLLSESQKIILQYIYSFFILFLVILFSFYSLKFAINTKARIYELAMISEMWIWLCVLLAGIFMIIHTVFVLYEGLYQSIGTK